MSKFPHCDRGYQGLPLQENCNVSASMPGGHTVSDWLTPSREMQCRLSHGIRIGISSIDTWQEQ